MARARTIKPSFFKNEDLAELDPYARLLFIGLWTLADREGRLEYRPVRIAAELFPYERDVDVTPLIDALHRNGFISRYEVKGKHYILVTNFKKHQHIHNKEQESELPGTDHPGCMTIKVVMHDNLAPCLPRTCPGQAPDLPPTNPSLILNPLALIPSSVHEPSADADGEGLFPESKDPAPRKPADELTEEFLDSEHERWYLEAYWKHVGKHDSRRAFEKRVRELRRSGETTTEAIRFLWDQAKRDRAQSERTKDWDWRQNLHPATWLNQKRWEDVPEGARQSAEPVYRPLMV